MPSPLTTQLNASVSPLAGRPAPKELLVDVAQLEGEYYERRPDLSDPNQMVSFGTSGHRGSSLTGVQLNVRVTLSAGKGAFGVIPEWVQGVAAGQMDESWINKHGQLDSKGGPWQNAFPKSRSLPGAKQV